MPPYFEKITLSPTLTSIFSSSVPGPTARTSASCGFSLALAESIRPPSVFSSASLRLITTLAPAALGPYSQAVMAGNTLYASGAIGIDPETGKFAGEDVQSQCEQACKNVGEILKANGMTYDNVVKTTCYILDMAEFKDFNEVYAKYFTSKPARSCVAITALPAGALCEVEIIAVK